MHLCTSVSEEGGDGEATCSETPSLCTCVSEEGGDGETACSETPSLLSYILRYVSFAEVKEIYLQQNKKRTQKMLLLFSGVK
jgi:hypothetical protein